MAQRVTWSLKGGGYDKNHLSYSFERVTKVVDKEGIKGTDN